VPVFLSTFVLLCLVFVLVLLSISKIPFIGAATLEVIAIGAWILIFKLAVVCLSAIVHSPFSISP
jgi:hypothetical protein